MTLKQEMWDAIGRQGKSDETFETYWYHCQKFIYWLRAKHGRWVHPSEVREDVVEQWLTDLARKECVAKNTQNLALQSLCYMYRWVIKQPLEGVSAMRAKKPEQSRDVIEVDEVSRLFAELRGVYLLGGQLGYGCGLRIGDVARLRIKDIYFERRQLHIHTGKGDKGRYTSFPEVLHEPVRRQIESMRVLYEWDLENNPNGVSLPGAFRKKSPKAGSRFMWYYLFCSDSLSRDRHGVLCRHHRDKSNMAREIRLAADRARLEHRVTSHILRHSYATHANEMGVDMRVLQQLLGHSDIRTTETYVHCNKHRATAAPSPLERILSSPQPNAQPLRVVKPDQRRTG